MKAKLRHHSDIYLSAFHLDREGPYPVVVAAETFTGLQRERLLVKGTCDLGFAVFAGAAGHAAGKGHLHFVRAAVLRGKPFAAARKVKDCDLLSTKQHAGPAVCRDILDPAGRDPF